MGSSSGTVLLGVSGSIAAYKAAEIVRGLRQASVEVHVAMTRNATRFITPLTLQTLSGNPVIVDPWSPGDRADIEHIDLGRRVGGFLVAPATANLLAKFARGIADDFLSTFYLAVRCPVLLAPAMNQRMFAHPATRENLEILRSRGAEVIEPEAGFLACEEEGPGRLADPARIVARTLEAIGPRGSLTGRTVLVTAGPTREAIDPVRFLSNASSGKMGYCLAGEARRRGATVILVSGPVDLPPPAGVEVERVTTAEEMRRAVHRRLPGADVLFMVAAVADFRPRRPLDEKWRRSRGAPPFELEPVPDLLAEIGRSEHRAILVGFAAETGSVAANARKKLQEKGLDLIAACDVGRGGIGEEQAAMTVLEAGGTEEEWPLLPKPEIAARLIDRVERRLRP
ncbi:MAG: bifunctional phosphopantothenoylcysteine decarboxylase/phosphopantothenate--cysteine ligase CoaBC [Acidobacteria bacterium]|nr:bifunctional phosphopantothenoylcysteine decarboxylase/phosphopantothenate--cysteine ligase CoaBC [Acidobacteriota bacterium]